MDALQIRPARISDAVVIRDFNLALAQETESLLLDPPTVLRGVSALLEDRDPMPNAVQSANWTCVGILAHESAMKGGEIIKLPGFTLQ